MTTSQIPEPENPTPTSMEGQLDEILKDEYLPHNKSQLDSFKQKLRSLLSKEIEGALPRDKQVRRTDTLQAMAMGSPTVDHYNAGFNSAIAAMRTNLRKRGMINGS